MTHTKIPKYRHKYESMSNTDIRLSKVVFMFSKIIPRKQTWLISNEQIAQLLNSRSRNEPQWGILVAVTTVDGEF